MPLGWRDLKAVTNKSNFLTKHLKETGESYWEHHRFALRLGGFLIYLGVTLLFHAFLPFLYTGTASEGIIKAHKKIANRMTND